MTRLLTARAVAELLGVSTETILRWSRRGELPSIRLPGGAIRFQSEALDEWLARRGRIAHADRLAVANRPKGTI
jgi:excisionase family DNA binding protein